MAAKVIKEWSFDLQMTIIDKLYCKVLLPSAG